MPASASRCRGSASSVRRDAGVAQPGQGQVHPPDPRVLDHVAGDVRELQRDAEVRRAPARGLLLHAHDVRHHQADDAGHVVAVGEDVVERLVAAALDVHREPLQQLEGIDVRDRVLLHHPSQRLEHGVARPLRPRAPRAWPRAAARAGRAAPRWSCRSSGVTEAERLGRRSRRRSGGTRRRAGTPRRASRGSNSRAATAKLFEPSRMMPLAALDQRITHARPPASPEVLRAPGRPSPSPS